MKVSSGVKSIDLEEKPPLTKEIIFSGCKKSF
jgi:hypothetical protein